MWNKYELCKVIKVLPNQLVIKLLKNDKSISVASKIKVLEETILVYDNSTHKVLRYDKTFKPLYRDYAQYLRFKNIIQDSENLDSYMSMYDQGLSFKEIYTSICAKNTDVTVINRINKHFKKLVKVNFNVHMPLYKHTLDELLLDKPIYYLNKNTFYTFIELNILNEKPYTKFFELYKSISIIDFDTVKT